MAPSANPPPDVAVVVVLDRYCQPPHLTMIIPLIQALNKQYPESHANGQIRLASVTFDTTQTNEMLNPVHWFENADQIQPRLSSKDVCLNRFGIRPNSSAKGKSAMVEGIVAGMELFEMQASEPFVEPAPPPPPVPSHTKLRSFGNFGVRKSTTPPVRHMFLLSALLPDTGARAIRNKYAEYDECTWGQLPEKLKALDVNLSMVYVHNLPKLAELHAAATTKPSEPWFNLPPHFRNFQILLAGFDNKLLSQASNPVTSPAKRPTPDSEANQSPNSKRPRVNGDAPPQPSATQAAPQPSALPGAQPAAVSSARPAPSQPAPAASAPSQPSTAPSQPAPGGLAGRRAAAGNISLPPLPPGGVTLPGQGQMPNQPAPGQPATQTQSAGAPSQWQSVLALNNQAQNASAGARGPTTRPNSVAPVPTVKQASVGGHSRSVSMQSGPNGMAAPVPTQLPGALLAGAQQGNVNISGQATSGAFPGQPQPGPGPGQQSNPSVTQGPITLPSPRAHPPGTTYPFPPTPPLQTADLNNPDAVKRALDKACNDYFQQLPLQLQNKVKMELTSNVQAASVEDIAKAKANSVVGALKVTAQRWKSAKHEKMHQNLYELMMARWPKGPLTGQPSLGNPPSVSSATSQQQTPAQPPVRPDSAAANGSAIQAQQRFLFQQQQYHRQQAAAALQKAQAQAQQQAQQGQQAPPQGGTTPQPDSPHIPLSTQVAARQLPRPVLGAAAQGNAVMRNSPIPSENQPPPNIARPPTTQPAQVQQQIAQMQQLAGQPGMGTMQQNAPQPNMPTQMQQGMPMMANSGMLPVQQQGMMQVPDQGQGGPEASRPPPANNEVLRDIVFTWKAENTGQNMMVATGVLRLNKVAAPSDYLIQILRTWPGRIEVPVWLPNRLHDRATLQKLMDFTLMFRLQPTLSERMGDKAQLNQAMFNQFYSMFQMGSRMAYVPLPMSGRNDTGLVLIHPPVPKAIRPMILVFCFHDKPVPPMLTGAASSSLPVPFPTMAPQNPMQMPTQQQHQQQQPQQQPQPASQQQGMINARPNLPLNNQEAQRQAYLRLALQAQQAQAQVQAQASTQGQMGPQVPIPQTGQPQALPQQTPQQGPPAQSQMQRTPIPPQGQTQQLPQQPQQPSMQQQQQRQSMSITPAQAAQLQAIIHQGAPPPGTDPATWQRQRAIAQQTLNHLRERQKQAASAMQNQAANQFGAQGGSQGMQGMQAGVPNTMSNMNHAAMAAMAQGLMMGNGGIGQQPGGGMGLPGGTNGVTVNQAMQNMFNQPSIGQQNAAFNPQQMQQAMNAMGGMGGMGGMNMAGMNIGGMQAQQQQGTGFNPQGTGQQGMPMMNLGFGGMNQQQGGQQGQPTNAQLSLNLLQAYLRNNKEGTM